MTLHSIRVALLAVSLVCLDAGAAAPSAPVVPAVPTNSRVRELISALNLAYLPKESGYLGFIGRSELKVSVEGRPLAAQNQVYYMLTADLPVNYLHWLAPDDTHILLEGGPVDYFIFHPDGRVELKTLGHDAAAGQQFVVAVPAGCWKALRLHPGVDYALMANVLTPEFTPDRVKIGAGEEFIRQYSGRAQWATPEFLRELIGPNFSPMLKP